MKRLLLIDSSSYIYRAFFALPPLTSEKGLPTGAIYGFIRMLLKLLEDFQTDYVVAVFDAKGKTIRHESYQDYKATRRETPNDLKQQIPYIKQILTLLGIKIVEMEGYEADDIIATLSKEAIKKGFEVIVVSPDKDMMQLVGEGVKVYNPVSEMLYDKTEVYKKYGVEANQFLDYLTLIGDTIDNVPGVKGVGPKTAQQLLTQFGSLEGIMKNIEKLPQKYRRLFEGISFEDVEKSRELLKLYTAPLDIQIESLKRDKADLIKLKELFEELGFKSFLKDSPKEKVKEKREFEQKSLF